MAENSEVGETKTSEVNMKTKRQIPGNVLADGEVTGHAHRVGVDVFESETAGVREFDGATKVTHEEHGPITLPQNQWVSAQVRELDAVEGMARPVRD